MIGRRPTRIPVVYHVLLVFFCFLADRTKAVVGGPAGPAMAVPLFLPSLYYCNVVLFFVFKLNQKSNNFINQPIISIWLTLASSSVTIENSTDHG